MNSVIAFFTRRRELPLSARVRRRLRRAARRRQRGMAFVMVLGALTILTVMLTEVQDQSSAELAGAIEARDALIAEYAAKSAVNLSRLLIASEPTIRKSVAPFLGILFGGSVPQIPVWVYSDRLLGAFNDPTGAEAFSSFAGLDLAKGKNLGLPGASFELAIVDEDSKLNLNIAAGSKFAQRRLMVQLMQRIGGPQYNPLFENRDPDGNFTDRQAICAALVDWADGDQETMLCDPTNFTAQEMPTEDSYYELLKKPYHRKNAAFDSLEELHRVRGIGDDFWATFVDPDPEHPEKRLFTVWGQQAVNINTAGPDTLLQTVCAVSKEPKPKFCIDATEMMKFLTILGLVQGMMPGVPAFGSPKAFVSLLQGQGPMASLLKGLGMEPITLDQDAQSQLTVESKVFSIYATGKVKAGRRETNMRIHAVVDFRSAQAPGQAQANQWGQTGAGAAPGANLGTGGTAATANAATGGSGAQPQLQAGTRTSPAGNVIYYRMD
jgi:general secretion pathway protein K